MPLELREVLNYVVAAEEAFGWVVDRPITVGLVERLQELLVADTPGRRHDAGHIRQRQVFVGSRGRPIEESRFIPPPPGMPLRAAVTDWLEWVRDGGHGKLPIGGHGISPLAAIVSPHGWPRFLPTVLS